MTDGDSEKGRFGLAGRLLKRYYHWRVANLDQSSERTLSSLIRPIVQPTISFKQDTIYCAFKNIGGGTAQNVATRIHHSIFTFDGPLSETAIAPGKEVKLNFPATEKPKPEKDFEVFTKYQDVGEKWFYSKLTQDELGQYRFEYERLEKLEKKDAAKKD